MRRITYLLLLGISALSLLSACGSDSSDSVTTPASIATLPEFEKSAQEVEAGTTRAMSEANAIVAKVAALKPGEATFANCVLALDDAYYLVRNTSQRLDLLANVSPDENVRDQASASVVLLGGWQIDTTSRKDVYAVLRAYADTNPKLAGEDHRLLDDTLRTYERNGLHLPDETRQQIVALQKELAAQEAAIQQNINAAAGDVVTVTALQAQGTPEKFSPSMSATLTATTSSPLV